MILFKSLSKDISSENVPKTHLTFYLEEKSLRYEFNANLCFIKLFENLTNNILFVNNGYIILICTLIHNMLMFPFCVCVFGKIFSYYNFKVAIILSKDFLRSISVRYCGGRSRLIIPTWVTIPLWLTSLNRYEFSH